MEKQQWYYEHDERRVGPISAAMLKKCADEGILLREDLVWHEGLPDWVPARKVRGLFREPPQSKATQMEEPIERPLPSTGSLDEKRRTTSKKSFWQKLSEWSVTTEPSLQLKPCRFCKHMVHQHAKTCPNCGGETPVQEISPAGLVVAAGCLTISVLFVGSCWYSIWVPGSSSNHSSKNRQAAVTDTLRSRTEYRQEAEDSITVEGRVLGRWEGSISSLTIIKHGDRTIMLRSFRDGSTTEVPIAVIESGDEHRVIRLDGSDDYWKIASTGDLKFYDNMGYIATATVVKRYMAQD